METARYFTAVCWQLYTSVMGRAGLVFARW